MSHRDAVSEVPGGFAVTASTDVCPIAAMENAAKNLYSTQFHPEVNHTECGSQMLSNFLFNICGFEKTWTMDNIIEQKVEEIRQKVGDGRVILALSGGVDSSVVAALVHRAIGDQLTCVFVNHGMLRKGEPEMVEQVFRKQFNVPLIHVHAEERYAELLAGVTEPEMKRRLIGTEFWKVFFDEAQKLDGVQFLAQGTIYPDIIESGARKTGGKAATIKSHHNLIPFPEGVHFDLIEPLDHFFKDEVRALAFLLVCQRTLSTGNHSQVLALLSASLATLPQKSWRFSATPTLLSVKRLMPTMLSSLTRQAIVTPSTVCGSTLPCYPTLSPLV